MSEGIIGEGSEGTILEGTIREGTILVTRLFGKVPFRNQTIWLPDHLLWRLIERDGLSAGAWTGGAVSHYQRERGLFCNYVLFL